MIYSLLYNSILLIISNINESVILLKASSLANFIKFAQSSAVTIYIKL